MTSAEPHWLDQEETDAWVALVGVLSHMPAAMDREIKRRVGLSHFEYLVMSALSEADERTLPMSELAGLSNGSLSRLSHTIARLEQRGWMLRATCPDNGRVTNATLTDDGYAKVVEAAPTHLRIARALVMDVLSRDQLRELTTIARQILTQVDPDSTFPPRGTAVRT